MHHISLFQPGAATAGIKYRAFRREVGRNDSEKLRTKSLTSTPGELPEKDHWRLVLKQKAK